MPLPQLQVALLRRRPARHRLLDPLILNNLNAYENVISIK